MWSRQQQKPKQQQQCHTACRAWTTSYWPHQWVLTVLHLATQQPTILEGHDHGQLTMPILGLTTVTWCIVPFTMTCGWNFSLVWRTAVIVLGILPYEPVWHLFSLAARELRASWPTCRCKPVCFYGIHSYPQSWLPSLSLQFTFLVFLMYAIFSYFYVLQTALYIWNRSKYKFKSTNTKRGSVSEDDLTIQ